uniref:Uncharacterized protein n=1 Tax=Peronospora matthiolae TaxID=2874970 RepID=A0AAV1TE99_9STRA
MVVFEQEEQEEEEGRGGGKELHGKNKSVGLVVVSFCEDSTARSQAKNGSRCRLVDHLSHDRTTVSKAEQRDDDHHSVGSARKMRGHEINTSQRIGSVRSLVHATHVKEDLHVSSPVLRKTSLLETG